MTRLDRSARGKRGYQDRKVNIREERQRFLIVCEGSKTEPNYFKEFRVLGLVIDIEGPALSPIQLVDEAHRLRQNKEKNYDQVWCVFDRDDWPVDNFNGALSKAQAQGIQVAYTNEAFELWYLLHFHYHDTAIGRETYKDRLTAHLGKAYVKNDKTIYGTLKTKIYDAIRNAERLLTQYNPPKPGVDNPSTTVHLLVQQLLRFAR